MSQPQRRRLQITTLLLDSRLQCRASIKQEVVEEYAEHIAAKVRFDPITVYDVGGELYVVDGFTRVNAHIAAGKEIIACEIHEGSWVDAVTAAIGANSRHGQQRTVADKRKAVATAMREFPTMRQSDLAEKCGLTMRTLQRIIADQKTPNAEKPAKVASSKEPNPATGGFCSSDCTPDESESRKQNSAPGFVAEPDVAEIDLCPVCNHNGWVLTDGGRVCDSCGHSHGESAANDEEETIEAPKQVTSEIPDNVPKQPERAIKRARTELGRLVRSIDSFGAAAAGIFRAELESINRKLNGLKE